MVAADASPTARALLTLELVQASPGITAGRLADKLGVSDRGSPVRSEEHTSELQSHRDLHSFPTRRSSDLHRAGAAYPGTGTGEPRDHGRPAGRQARSVRPGLAC